SLPVAKISSIRNDHETGKPDTDPEPCQLITGHAHSSILHQHHRLHAAQPSPTAQSNADPFIADRNGHKMGILGQPKIDRLQPAIGQKGSKLDARVFQSFNNFIGRGLFHLLFLLLLDLSGVSSLMGTPSSTEPELFRARSMGFCTEGRHPVPTRVAIPTVRTEIRPSSSCARGLHDSPFDGHLLMKLTLSSSHFS